MVPLVHATYPRASRDAETPYVSGARVSGAGILVVPAPRGPKYLYNILSHSIYCLYNILSHSIYCFILLPAQVLYKLTSTMPKVSTNSPARKKQKKGGGGRKKKQHQLTLMGGPLVQKKEDAGKRRTDGDPSKLIVKHSKELVLCEKDILLTTDIYGSPSAVPKEMKGMLFHYLVMGYNSISKKYTIQYRNRMIKEDGVEWQENDGGRESLPDFGYDTVKKGRDEYLAATYRISNHRAGKVSLAQAVLKKKGEGDDEEVDMTDLEEAAHSTERGWWSQEVMEVDFELTGETG